MSAVIQVDGASAALRGVKFPAALLKECLSFLHPGRFFNRAFKEGRWDGSVCLADGAGFPAGFTARVRRHLARQGIQCGVVARGTSPVDPERLTPDFLHGIRLRDYQLGAIREMLRRPRGILKEPTGSGKTAIVAAAARLFWEEKGWRSLIVVPKKGLASQTKKALDRFYNGEVRVGIVGDGHRRGGAVVVSTAQTLVHFASRKVKRRGHRKRVNVEGEEWLVELLEQTDVLFLDECHRSSSTQWQTIAENCFACRRYGLSGTPLRDEEWGDLKLEAACGRMIHETKSRDLIDRKLVARPKIAMVMSSNSSEILTRAHGRFPPYRESYREAIVDSDTHNSAVVMSILWLLKRKRRVLVLCRLKDHFATLAEMLQDAGVEVACLWGDTPTEERDEAKQEFAAGSISCILATTIFDEGEDVGGIDAIVLAEGVAVNTSALQRIGRGMRKDSADVWVVDFVPMGSPVLHDHAIQRCKTYEAEGYEVEVVENWPQGFHESPPKDLLPFCRWSHPSLQPG